MKKLKKILMMAVVLLTAIGASSQAPGIFNYQGVARNSVGNVLINKTINLRLTIHDLTSGGAVVYQETRLATTNPFGLFNVQVGGPGFVTQVGTVTAVNWSVGNKFLQVEIDPNGGTTFINIGTAQIASVPYALFSNGAGDLVLPFNKTQADNGTLFKITNSGNGSGSTALEGLTNSTAANVNAITGTVTNTSPGSSSSGVRGINNGTSVLGIGVWGSQNGGGWGVYGSVVSGIGVRGEATSGTGVYGTSSTGNAGKFEITNSANNTDAIQALTNGAAASWAIRATSTGAQGAGIFTYNNAAGTANALRVTSNGTGFAANITNTNGVPLALRTAGGLQFTGINEGVNRVLSSDAAGNATWQNLGAIGGVTGSGTVNFLPKWTPTGTNLGNSQVQDNGNGVSVGFPFFANNSLTTLVTPGAPVDPSMAMISASAAAGQYLENATGNVHFTLNNNIVASGTKVMTFTNNTFNVGVGTTTPGAKLHVNGSANINLTLGVAVFAHNAFVAKTGTGATTQVSRAMIGYADNSSVENHGAFAYANGTGSSFNVGVFSLSFGTTSGTNFGFYTNVGNSSTSNIGIQSNAPLGANDFAGVFNGRVKIVDGTQGAGKVFTSNAAGTGSWVALGAIGGVSGSGTLNFMPKWTPNGSTLGNSNVFVEPTNFTTMINSTTMPTDNALGVTGSVQVDAGGPNLPFIFLNSTGVGSNGGIIFTNSPNTGTSDNGRFLYRSGGDYLSISHRNGGATTNGLADFTVKNGNIGIATIAPAVRFHAVGSSAGFTSEYFMDNNSNSGFSWSILSMRSTGTASRLQGLYFEGTASSNSRIFFNETGLFANHLVLTTSNSGSTTDITINKATTNVGVGRVNAGAKLHVDGSSDLTVNVNGVGVDHQAFIAQTRAAATTNVARAGVFGVGNSTFENQGALLIANGTSGNNVGAFAYVTGATPGTNYGYYVNVIGGSSNVGIQTNTFGGPNDFAAIFNGRVQIADGTEGAGKVFTSDATGIGSWQGPVGISIRNISGSPSIPNATATPITQWQTIQDEDGGANYNNVTGEYTITVTGEYQINASIFYTGFATPGATSLWIDINGVFEYNTWTPSSTSQFANVLSYAKKLNAGDKVNFLAYQTSGATQTIAGGVNTNAFSINLIHR